MSWTCINLPTSNDPVRTPDQDNLENIELASIGDNSGSIHGSEENCSEIIQVQPIDPQVQSN